jgi:hypothetical protein
MPPRHYLSACLCFKDAAAYLPEWLAFYTALGVEHFHLYNNESTDDFRSVLAPYLESGKATLTNFPGRGVQQAIYAHCLGANRTRSRWILFCDDDEFLFPVQDISLAEALEPYEQFAGVAVPWMLYGSSGHETPPAGLVLENFTERGVGPDAHVKCIVDPRRVIRPVVIGHQFACVGSNAIVDENGVPVRGPFAERPSASVFRINHYVTKSREEMRRRRGRIQANTGKISPLSLEQWAELELHWNEVHDPIATRYATRVATEMAAQASAAAVVFA